MWSARITTTAIALAFAACLLSAQDKKEDRKSEATPAGFDLSVRFEKDRKARYQQTVTVSTETEVMGQKNSSKQETSNVSEFHWTEVAEDGNATVVLEYASTKFKQITNGEVAVEFDTETDKIEDIDPNYRSVALMQDFKYTTTISPTGKVTKVSGWDAYIDAVKEAAPAETAEMFVAMLKEDTIRDGVEWMYYHCRKDTVKLGYTWEHKLELDKPMIGKTTYTRKYTAKEVVEKLGRKCLRLELKGDISTPEGSSHQFKEVDWTGEIWVDTKTAELVAEDSRMKFTMSMKFGGMEISSPSDTHTTTSLITEEEDENADGKKD